MSSPPNPVLRSEEDVRQKVVLPWLASHGFGPGDISLEFGFNIRLGHGIRRIGSAKGVAQHLSAYADVLVRAADGRNLLVVEVKASHVSLSDADRDQAISYARTLDDGGIAPFAILTNGLQVRCFDTITREEISGTSIPDEHRHVVAGFRVGGSALTQRAEALRHLVSLGPENLMAFCEGQVSYRMARLKGENSRSDRKYIPQLYVERETFNREFSKHIESNDGTSIIVVGHPQVGKTTLLCRAAERLIASGTPCLFYPAIGMQGGLVEAIEQDLFWGPGPDSGANLKRFFSIARGYGKRVVVIVDGWNEASGTVARQIDEDAARIGSISGKLVVSFTSPSAARLLLGPGGNPTYIGESVGLDLEATWLLRYEARHQLHESLRNRPIIKVTPYSDEEVEKAYETYARAFDVKVPTRHKKTDDPFLLRIAMANSSGGELPIALDEPALIQRTLLAKCMRASGLLPDSARACVEALATEMASRGEPVTHHEFARVMGLALTSPLPSGLFDAAILAETGGAQRQRRVDFYYERERNFAIAYWVNNWGEGPKLERATELLRWAGRNRLAAQAVTWFLALRANEEMRVPVASVVDHSCPLPLLTLLIDALLESNDPSWEELPEDLRSFVRMILAHPNKNVAISAARLAPALHDWPDFEGLIGDLLAIHDTHPLRRGSAGELVLEAFQELHMQHAGGDSPITEVLVALILEGGKAAEAAAMGLAHLDPERFFSLANGPEGAQRTELWPPFRAAFSNAAQSLDDQFYGSEMCPTWMSSFEHDPDGALYQYKQLVEICRMPLANYGDEGRGEKILLSLLEALFGYSDGADGIEAVARPESLRRFRRKQGELFDLSKKMPRTDE